MRTLFFLLLFLAFNSCASVITGSRDTIFINSYPEGATVLIDDVEVGETPILLRVKRNLGQRWLTLDLNGYETERYRFDKKFNWVSVINFTCLTCWAIDAATGNLVKFADKRIELALEPEIPQLDSIRVDTIDRLP